MIPKKGDGKWILGFYPLYTIRREESVDTSSKKVSNLYNEYCNE
jgi:hypothetical protein